MGRPPITADPNEREALRELIQVYHGNTSAMAKAVGNIDRQTLARRLGLLGLLEEADRARAAANVKGPRIRLRNGSLDPDAERREIVGALARNHGYRAAATELKISARTMVRKMRKFAITPEHVAKERKQITSSG